MRLLRGLAGSLLWILAGVVGLLGIVLSATILLLPLGIPLLMLARRLFRYSMTMFLPREVRHPVQELGKSARGRTKDAANAVKPAKKGLKRARKSGKKAGKKGKKFAKQQLKRVS